MTADYSLGTAKDNQTTNIIVHSDILLDRLMNVSADLSQALDRLAGAQPLKGGEAMDESGDSFIARLLQQQRRLEELIVFIEDSTARLREVV